MTRRCRTGVEALEIAPWQCRCLCVLKEASGYSVHECRTVNGLWTTANNHQSRSSASLDWEPVSATALAPAPSTGVEERNFDEQTAVFDPAIWQCYRVAMTATGMKSVSSSPKTPPPFDPEVFLEQAGVGRTLIDLKKKQVLFSQGDPADAVFYIKKGNVKLTVVSQRGKEAAVALLDAGNFVGESCIAAAERVRLVTATALTRSTLMRIESKVMVRVLHDEHAFADVFV